MRGHPRRAVTALVRSRSSAGPGWVGLLRRDVGCGCASASGRACAVSVRGSGGNADGPVGVQLVDQFVGDLGEFALVGIGQPGRQLLERHPGHLADLDVLVGQFAAEEPHQVVVHGLVHPPALGDEPVVDAAERGQHAALDSGLLGDLADRGLLGGLTEFDVALGQRPQHPAASVDPADQGRDLAVLRAVDPVDDQAARRCLVHGAQPVGSAPRAIAACAVWALTAVGPGRPSVLRHDRIVVVTCAVAVSGGPAARRPRRRPRRRRGLACSPSDTQAIVAATQNSLPPHSPLGAGPLPLRSLTVSEQR